MRIEVRNVLLYFFSLGYIIIIIWLFIYQYYYYLVGESIKCR